MIHQTAVIDPEAQLGRDVTVGPFAIVEKETVIGDGCILEARSHVKRWTSLGSGNRLCEGAILGGTPQHLGYKGEETWLRIGDNNYFGEYCTIHRGSTITGKTVVGSDNYFMGYTHAGHDCRIGNRCVMTAYSGLAGHTILEDRVIMGAYAGTHQFVRIGTMCMAGAGSLIGMDLVPYMIYQGYPAKPMSVNLVGLRRNDVPEPTRNLIRRVFRILFRSDRPLAEKIEQVRALGDVPEVRRVIEFIEKSERGIAS